MTAPIGKWFLPKFDILADHAAEDLNIALNDEAWVLGTYSMVFAATCKLDGTLHIRSQADE